MKLKHCILCCCFLLAAHTTRSQSYLYYFDDDLNTCKKSKAFYTGYGTKVNGYVNLAMVFNRSGKVAVNSHYKDSSLSVLEGLYQVFYWNGKLEREGFYLNNKEDGEWKIWDSTGNLMNVTFTKMVRQQ